MSRRRRLLLGLVMAVIWLGIVVGGSNALLNDSTYLTNNSLVTGSVGMSISSSQEFEPALSSFNKTQAGFFLGLISPGEYIDRYFTLYNTSPGNFILTVDMRSNVTAGNPAMAQAVSVEVNEVDGMSNLILGKRATSSLFDMADSPVPITDVEIPSRTMKHFRMRVKVAASHTKSDDTIAFDMVFTGTQKPI